MLVNKEYLHSRWLGEIRDFALKYFKERFGGGTCRAAIIATPRTDEFVFNVVREMDMPMGSDFLITMMARFCKCSFDGADGIVGFCDGIPDATFCLHSLLMAAYPRDVYTGIFKDTDGALGPEEVGPNPSEEKAEHVAFAGLGVIVMQGARNAFGEMLPDEKVVEMSHDHFLAIA